MYLNCKGRLIDLNIPKVMGILNLTPDSFYDGGRYKDESSLRQQVEKMLAEGATFIDLGAYSTRPGAAWVSEEEESRRLMPILELLLKHFPEAILSVDTFRHSIAASAVSIGVAIINDISGGQFDIKMLETVAQLQVPYVAMHLRGTLETMHQAYDYDNITQETIFYFSEKLEALHKLGLNDVIIDPGFGFSKNVEQNFELLNKLEAFQMLNVPVLVGLSRKSMIWKTLQINPEAALNGTTALNTIALLKKATILRVHDVKEAVECIRLTQQLAR